MRALFRAELRLLGCQWYFPLFLALAAAILLTAQGLEARTTVRRMQPRDGAREAVTVNQDGMPLTGCLLLSDGMLLLWGGGVLAAGLIGRGFENRTLGRAVALGHSRGAVFSEKLLFYYLYGLALSGAARLSALAVFSPESFSCTRVLLRYLLYRAAADLAALSIPLFLAFLCRDLIRTSTLAAAHALLLWAVLSGMLAGDGAVMDALRLHPLLEVRSLILPALYGGGDAGRFFAVSGLLFLTMNAGAYLLFRRCEFR